MEFIQQHWAAIAGAVAAIVGAGLAIRLMWARPGRDTTIVNQRHVKAGGDVVGRDKVTRKTGRR